LKHDEKCLRDNKNERTKKKGELLGKTEHQTGGGQSTRDEKREGMEHKEDVGADEACKREFGYYGVRAAARSSGGGGVLGTGGSVPLFCHWESSSATEDATFHGLRSDGKNIRLPNRDRSRNDKGFGVAPKRVAPHDNER